MGRTLTDRARCLGAAPATAVSPPAKPEVRGLMIRVRDNDKAKLMKRLPLRQPSASVSTVPIGG